MSSSLYEKVKIRDYLAVQKAKALEYTKAGKQYPDLDIRCSEPKFVTILSVNREDHHGMIICFQSAAFFKVLQLKSIPTLGLLNVESDQVLHESIDGENFVHKFHIVKDFKTSEYYLHASSPDESSEYYQQLVDTRYQNFYCGQTKLSKTELQQLAIMVVNVEADRYALTLSDCVEFAKSFCRRIAVHENDANDSDLEFLNKIAVSKCCVFRELELSSRDDVSGSGQSAGSVWASGNQIGKRLPAKSST